MAFWIAAGQNKLSLDCPRKAPVVLRARPLAFRLGSVSEMTPAWVRIYVATLYVSPYDLPECHFYGLTLRRRSHAVATECGTIIYPHTAIDCNLFR